jgi:hypothetical protein
MAACYHGGVAAGDRDRWTIPAAIAAALVALVAWSTWQRYAFLTSSPFPLGIDGYYYPTQLRALLERGALYYPTSPLAFWLMAPLAWLTDPITGAKLGAALGGALVALPAYAVGRRLGGHRAAGLAAAVIATTSAGSWYLSVEFVKNGWGITVALTAVWLVLRLTDDLRSTNRWVLAVAGLGAAALTHKMALVLAALCAAPALAVAIARRSRREVDQRELVSRIAARGAAYGILTIVGLLAVAGMVVFDALDPIAALVTSHARWHAPALSLDGGRFELMMGHEPLAAGVVALVAAAVLAARHADAGIAWPAGERTAPATAAAWAVIAFALVVALPVLAVDDPQGLGFRLRIVAFVPLALAAAVVVGPLAVLLAARIATWPGVARRVAGPAIAGALAFAAVALAPAERPEGVVRAHPAMVTAVMALDGAIPAGDTFVASERAIGLMATWYTRRPFVLRPERAAPARRWRLMTRAFIGEGTSLYRLLLAARREPALAPPRGTHPGDPNGLVIVPEATWQWILERLPPVPQRHYSEWHTI